MYHNRKLALVFFLLFSTEIVCGQKGSVHSHNGQDQLIVVDPVHVKPDIFSSHTSSSALESTCISWLTEYQKLNSSGWKLNSSLESLGGFHLQFTQTVHGTPVTGHGASFHFDHQGRCVSAWLQIVPDDDFPLSSRVRPPDTAQLNEQARLTYQGKIFESETAWLLMPDGYWQTAQRISTYEDQLGGSHELWYNLTSGELLKSFSTHCNFTSETRNGKGRVFNPDPLSTGNTYYFSGTPYADNADRNNIFFDSQYKTVDLLDLKWENGRYYLEGPHVRIEDISAPANKSITSANGDFFYDRSNAAFEQVNGYYHIDHFQRYIQSIGYTNLLNYPFRMDVRGYTIDQSAFFPAGNQSYILMGIGGVDDAEDADVLIHEYSHALSNFASPSTRFGTERLGIDEGFGDYFAASYSRSLSEFRWADLFTWDGHNEYWEGRSATYNLRNYPYLNKNSRNIYEFGELWATALMRVWPVAGRENMDRIVLEALFMSRRNMSVVDGAQAIFDADTLLFDGRYTMELQRSFCASGILEGQICDALSVTPIRNRPEFAIFPNPFSSEINIDVSLPFFSGGVEIELYNLIGQQVFRSPLYSQSNKIALPHGLIEGLYTLRIVQGGQTLHSEKLIHLE